MWQQVVFEVPGRAAESRLGGADAPNEAAPDGHLAGEGGGLKLGGVGDEDAPSRERLQQRPEAPEERSEQRRRLVGNHEDEHGTTVWFNADSQDVEERRVPSARREALGRDRGLCRRDARNVH